MSPTIAVLVAVLIIWGGVFAYLVTLDRKVARAERAGSRHEG